VEPGLYLTFFTEGEPYDSELPPVGPLEHVVVRDRKLLADRRDDGADHFGGGGRWIEAEHELRRATGEEPGGTKRPDLRIGGPEGVYLRFVSFGEDVEPDPVPELGPYAVVIVGRRGVEADGDSLATRTGTNQTVWQLTGVGGSAFMGVVRPDIAFRTRSTSYHPELKPFRAAGRQEQPPSPPTAPSRVAAPGTTRAVDQPRTTRPPEDPGLTLRDRIGTEQPAYAVAPTGADPREWGGAAWQLRYFIIGALVVLLVVFSVPSISSFLTSANPSLATVGAGTPVTSPDWTYQVGNVRRVATIGAAQAIGTYVVVRVAATNRGRAGAQLLPRNFTLTAASGEHYAALPATDNAYSGAENPGSTYLWPTDFPVGRQIVVPLIFDVNPSTSGMQLAILDVPSTRIRLE
jgi:hypothetical protein